MAATKYLGKYNAARRHVKTDGLYVDKAAENVRVEDFNDDGFVSKKEIEGHDKLHDEAARKELLAYIESARRDVAGRFAVFIARKMCCCCRACFSLCRSPVVCSCSLVCR